MATTQELLRKIALDSHHQTIQSNKPKRQRPNGFKRPRSHSGAELSKSIHAMKSLKTNKSRSKDTNHAAISHLPSIPKPFKSVKHIFKRPKHDKDSSDAHLQSRSFSGHPHRKAKSKARSRHKNHSESNLSKPMNLNKLIDTQLLQQYQQYVENRVEMLRSRAFPNEVIYQLPQYRADLTDSLAQSRPKPHFSRHKECDELIQADLRKHQQHALEHATKLPKQHSTLKTIKHLFHPSTGTKAKTPDIVSQRHIETIPPTDEMEPNPPIPMIACDDSNILSPTILELKFNIVPTRQRSVSFDENALTPHPESTASISEEPKNESVEATPYSLASISQIPDSVATQLISSLSVHNKMSVILDNDEDEESRDKPPELTPSPNDKDATPILPPLMALGYTMDPPSELHCTDKEEFIKRASTFQGNGKSLDSIQKHRRCASDPSPTPPFFTTRTPNVRSAREQIFDLKLMRSSTPSWAKAESTGSDDDSENETTVERHTKHAQMKSNNTVLIHDDYEILESKYNTLESQYDELHLEMRSMQQGMEEQKNRINLLTQQMHEMQDAMKKQSEDTQAVRIPEAQTVRKKKKNTRFYLHYFDYNYGKFWAKFQAKILKESDRISFERSKWENLYHSLLSYFMNGLMVLWMGCVFLFGCFACCERSNEDNNVNKKKKKANDDYKIKFSDVNCFETMSQRSNSRSVKRRNKLKKKRLRRNNDMWRDVSDERENETPSSEC